MKKINNKIIGFIPARYGSKRFPGKPLKLISGTSLLQRSFERAKLCSLFDEIFIITDHDEIRSHAQSFCDKVYMTSENCKNGSERIIEALDLIDGINDDDIIVNVQGDHPLLTKETIEKTISVLIADENAMMSTAATKIINNNDALSPNIVKVIFDTNKNALYFSRSLIPYSKNIEKGIYYYHVGLYAYRKKFLSTYKTLPPSKLAEMEDLEQLNALENGYKIKIALVEEAPIGVDIPEDILKVEKYLCQ